MNRNHWIAVGALAGGLLLVIGLGWNFLLRPLAQDYDAAVEKRDQLKQQLDSTRQRALQFEKFKAEAENVRRDLDFYSRRLAPDLRASELYSLIDGIGNSYNFGSWLFEVKPGEKSKMQGGTLDEYEVKATIETDLEHLGLFTNACVSQVRIIVPETFVLTRLQDSTGLFRQTLKAVYTLKVFTSAEGKK